MKSALVDGKIPIPRSLGAARLRHEQLVTEVARIDRQIADPNTRSRYRHEREYQKWHGSATRCRNYLAEEARQLAQWIEAQPESRLLPELLTLLDRLREDGVDYDEDEEALIGRLRVAVETTPRAAASQPPAAAAGRAS